MMGFCLNPLSHWERVRVRGLKLGRGALDMAKYPTQPTANHPYVIPLRTPRRHHLF